MRIAAEMVLSNNLFATQRRHGRLSSTLINVLLLAAIAWLLVTIVAAAAVQNTLFDGAMNLEVSRSLAEGAGPRRLYDFNDYFPHGVQTKEPYVILGALVFKLFGVGPFQVHLPNLIFIAFLCATILVAVNKLSGFTTAIASVLVVLATPMLIQYGLNGYGELPSLAFGLSALAMVAWPGRISDRLAFRCLIAGGLAGLALATKTVAAIQVAAIALTLMIRLLVESDAPMRDLLRGLAAFALGVLAPLLLIEGWRWSWLGGAGYKQWWMDEFAGILYQAGVTPQGTTVPVLSKVSKHFGLLTNEIGRSSSATAALLALPLLFAGFFIANPANPRAPKWWLLGLAAISTCYMVWWMGITPTEKAWLRRIYIGLIALSLLGMTALFHSIRTALDARIGAPLRFGYSVLAVALIALYAPFVKRAIQVPVSFSPTPGITETLAAARFVSGLGPDSLVFAHGWYAAPTVALHSGRRLIDFTDWPIGDFPGRNAYVVADRATFVTHALDGMLARYPHEAMLKQSTHAQVYKIDFSSPTNPFTEDDMVKALSYVEFAKTDSAATYGMTPYDAAMQGRWAGSDSEVLLRYDGQPTFELSGYMALPKFFRKPVPLSGRVIIEGCPSVPFGFETTGWKQFRMPLQCRPKTGSTVRVRILLNNTFDLPLVYDHQRALLLSTVGFVDMPSDLTAGPTR